MIRELEYHIRALLFALFATIAVLSWNHGRSPDIIKDICVTLMMFWLAALTLLYWRSLDAPIRELAHLIKELLRHTHKNGHNKSAQ